MTSPPNVAGCRCQCCHRHCGAGDIARGVHLHRGGCTCGAGRGDRTCGSDHRRDPRQWLFCERYESVGTCWLCSRSSCGVVAARCLICGNRVFSRASSHATNSSKGNAMKLKGLLVGALLALTACHGKQYFFHWSAYTMASRANRSPTKQDSAPVRAVDGQRHGQQRRYLLSRRAAAAYGLLGGDQCDWVSHVSLDQFVCKFHRTGQLW